MRFGLGTSVPSFFYFLGLFPGPLEGKGGIFIAGTWTGVRGAAGLARASMPGRGRLGSPELFKLGITAPNWEVNWVLISGAFSVAIGNTVSSVSREGSCLVSFGDFPMVKIPSSSLSS